MPFLDSRAAQYWLDFQRQQPDVLASLEHYPERASWLTAIFECSCFLSEELLRHPEWLASIGDLDVGLTRDDFRERLTQFQNGTDLALFRRHELLRIVLRDRLERARLSEVTEEISNLADVILSGALERARTDLAERYLLPEGAFCMLALGKLGGCELNYSSDVDLMFVYRGSGEEAEYFKKLAAECVRLVSTHTAAGLCYRVDLRLRPEGNFGEIAISLDSAKEYYSKRARAWELQMLIKARACAGDLEVGRELLEFVEPLIYATTDDFSTIEAMSAARERIGEKVARRRRKEHATDVKLARGGIRDVEFLVQCLQRLHGAREVRVRHGSTLEALERLYDGDLLSSTEYWRLTGAYEYFRRLEHLLQLKDDRQTHSLPAGTAELERLAGLVNGREDGAAAQMLADLKAHRENVETIYERIVHAQRPPRQGQVQHTADEFPSRLSEQTPQFVETVRKQGISEWDRPLTTLLERLPARPEQIRMLEEHPVLREWLPRIFELSPYLVDQLTRYPELLEEVRRAADHPRRRWAFEGLAAPLTDLGALRRFFRREMFRIQVTSVCLPERVFATLDNTSALAEFVIARAYRIALERGLEHARAHPPIKGPAFTDPASEMMVVAVGRLGMREFDLASDADLLFILPDSESGNHLFWTRVAEHLIEILTTYTGDGTILSLDTRLRPNGREGLLVQTESAYVEYFAASAKAWEGIAYMKARAVAGDTERGTEFLHGLQREMVWRRHGQGDQARSELRHMRLRLQREQGQATPLKAGEGAFYDADFILMYLRLRGAGFFYNSLNTPERIDVVEKMGQLEREDAEFLTTATTYFRALDHAIRLVTGHAEEKIPGVPALRVMVSGLLQRWMGRPPSMMDRSTALETELAEVKSRMRRLFEQVFG